MQSGKRGQPARGGAARTRPSRETAPGDDDGEMRIAKAMARAGLCSRREAERWIQAGRVSVNGKTLDTPAHVVTPKDLIEVDGKALPQPEPVRLWRYYKPKGQVTTHRDPQGRPTVVELVPDDPRVFPVGRLDADSEGLLILTNDGDLAHRLTHPSFGVDKEYLVTVEGTPSRGALRRLRQGVELEDGITAPAKVATLAPHLLGITIHEGRNRQIRRMCDAVGHPVTRLVRHRIGPVSDTRLPPGAWRSLTPVEVRDLALATAPGEDDR